MTGADTFYDALTYALDKTGGAVAPVAVVNATGLEDETFFKQSSNACYKLEDTLNSAFSTLLIRATRQNDETLGLVAMATAYATPGARIYVAQENAHGAPGLEKMLKKAFPEIQTIIKFKCRTMVFDAGSGDPAVLSRWQEKAGIHKVKHNRGEFWSAPGVFSWDRPDAGSILLLAHLPNIMPGRIADLGCGNGLLSGALAKKEGATELFCIDADARSVECTRRNLEERGVTIPVHTLWRDATDVQDDVMGLDFVVTNPPFHDQQNEDRGLGQKFCLSALKMLRAGGALYLVANRHLPYETILEDAAAQVTLLADTGGFKIIRALAK